MKARVAELHACLDVALAGGDFERAALRQQPAGGRTIALRPFAQAFLRAGQDQRAGGRSRLPVAALNGPLQTAEQVLAVTRVHPDLGAMAQRGIENTALAVFATPTDRVVAVRARALRDVDAGGLESQEFAQRQRVKILELVDLVGHQEIGLEQRRRRVRFVEHAHAHLLVPGVAVERAADHALVGRVFVERVGRAVHTDERATVSNPGDERVAVGRRDRQFAGGIERDRGNARERRRIQLRAILRGDHFEIALGQFDELAFCERELVGCRSLDHVVHETGRVREEQDLGPGGGCCILARGGRGQGTSRGNYTRQHKGHSSRGHRSSFYRRHG